MKRYVMLLAVMALLVAALALPAFAQPPAETPPSEQGPEHARSICSFSGINDHDPLEPPGGRTQSYGQEVRGPDAAKPSEVPGRADTPGFLCNPQQGPFEGPFEEPVEE